MLKYGETLNISAIKNSKRKADYEPTSYGEETRVYEGGGIVQLVKRRPIFPNDENIFMQVLLLR